MQKLLSDCTASAGIGSGVFKFSSLLDATPHQRYQKCPITIVSPIDPLQQATTSANHPSNTWTAFTGN